MAQHMSKPQPDAIPQGEPGPAPPPPILAPLPPQDDQAPRPARAASIDGSSDGSGSGQARGSQSSSSATTGGRRRHGESHSSRSRAGDSSQESNHSHSFHRSRADSLETQRSQDSADIIHPRDLVAHEHDHDLEPDVAAHAGPPQPPAAAPAPAPLRLVPNPAQLQLMPRQAQPPLPPVYQRQLRSRQEFVEWLTNNTNVVLRVTARTIEQLRQLYGRDFVDVCLDFVGFYGAEIERVLEDADYLGVFIRIGSLPSPEWLHAEIQRRFGDEIPDLPSLPLWQELARGIYQVPYHGQQPPLQHCLVCLCRPAGMPVVRHQSSRCPFARNLPQAALQLLGRTCLRCGKRDRPANRASHRCTNPQPCTQHGPRSRPHLPFLHLCDVDEGHEQDALDNAEQTIIDIIANIGRVRFSIPLDRGFAIPADRPPYRGLQMAMHPLPLPPNFQEIIDMEPRLKLLLWVISQDLTGRTVEIEEIEERLEAIENAEHHQLRLKEQRLRNERLGRAMAHRQQQLAANLQHAALDNSPRQPAPRLRQAPIHDDYQHDDPAADPRQPGPAPRPRQGHDQQGPLRPGHYEDAPRE